MRRPVYYSIFRDWESFVRTNQVNIQLEKLVLINFKSNTSDGNLNQFINLMNYHFPFAIFQNLKEFYLQIDDFSNMKPKKNHSQNQNQIDSFNLQILLHNLTKLPALTKLTIPDFFNLWFTNVEFNPQNSNYFDQMVNKCDCADCNHGRALYNRYAKYDSLNGYKHKFENIEIATTKGNDSKIDIELPCNFRFLNYVVNTLRDRLSFSHKNIFTINSILKMDDIEYSVTTENSIFKEIVDVIIHLCLQERFKELSKDTGIKQVNLGGIVLKDI